MDDRLWLSEGYANPKPEIERRFKLKIPWIHDIERERKVKVAQSV
jgi:hypothetical protein